MKFHTVKTNESIWRIAKSYHINPKLLLQHNPELQKRNLYIGEEIIIPSKVSLPPALAESNKKVYYVKKGDTLYGIAKKNKLTLRQLKNLNQLSLNDGLIIGQRLLLSKESNAKKNKLRRYKNLFALPLKGPITSRFGRRKNPFLRNRISYHKGVDIGAEIGTPFFASADGIVVRAQRMGGYGNCIFILHSNDYISIYAHNKKNLVKKGQVLKQGDLIGLVGRTGTATGPHLHFEIRKNLKKAIDPFKALKIKKVVLLQ